MTTLAPALQEQLLHWSLSAAPQEGCGLLFGQRTEDGFIVERALLAENGSQSEDSFLVPPDLLLAHARDPSWIGIWHSHPRGPAALSEHDRRGAASWPRLLQCLVSPPQTILLFSPLAEGLAPLPWRPASSPRLAEWESPGVVRSLWS